MPSGLRERYWKRVITTSSDDLIEDSFVPALKVAKQYDRGVGYFSSGWIQAASEGLLAFAANGGSARWVTSPILSLAVWEALRSGYEAWANVALHRALMRNIETLEASLRAETTSNPRREKFAQLTTPEERAGLYEETNRIGEETFWNEFLMKG
ncbi:MAG: hypothetical protein RLY93_09650 [Sumerlaeia bacterium]